MCYVDVPWMAYSLNALPTMKFLKHEEIHWHMWGSSVRTQALYVAQKAGILLTYMILDCVEFEKSCQICQYHGNFIRVSPEPLHTITHFNHCVMGNWRHRTFRKSYDSRIHLYSSCYGLLLQMGWGQRFHHKANCQIYPGLYHLAIRCSRNHHVR